MLLAMIDDMESRIQTRIDSYKVKKEKAADNYDKANQGAKIKASIECLHDVQTFRERVKRAISERAGVSKPREGGAVTEKRIVQPCPHPVESGEPCNHRGCLNHVSHPCEGCGRTAGCGDYTPKPPRFIE